MPVTRSALARRAARSARSASSVSPGRGRGGGRRRRSALPSPTLSRRGGATMPSSTSQRASLATRSTLSATVPSFSWKTISSSFFACSSSGTLRSCSQKNLASDRRAARTLRLPSTIAAPPSAASILAVQTKFGASAPVRVRAGEIFLVGAHGELDHLARHVEEGRVEAAEQRHRPFGEAGILGDQALVLDQRQAAPRRRRWRRRRAMIRLALGRGRR